MGFGGSPSTPSYTPPAPVAKVEEKKETDQEKLRKKKKVNTVLTGSLGENVGEENVGAKTLLGQ
jgi:hypothetical protein